MRQRNDRRFARKSTARTQVLDMHGVRSKKTMGASVVASDYYSRPLWLVRLRRGNNPNSNRRFYWARDEGNMGLKPREWNSIDRVQMTPPKIFEASEC